LKQYYPYESFKNDTRTLLKRLKTFKPEAIVGIARGGLSLSHALAEGMNIREVETVRTELYDGSAKREELTLYGECNLVGKQRVLVADDIADSGETLFVVMKHLKERFPEIEFQSATLFYKTSSKYEPDFWINEAHNWIEFFWEVDFKS
jgi:xanthine phosphoribosyltransferase